MSRKLSLTMQKALAAISRHGGEAHPDGSCYWRSKPIPDGERLRYALEGANGHVDCVIETSTVKSLVSRGFLELIGEADSAADQSYRVTAKAHELCAWSSAAVVFSLLPAAATVALVGHDVLRFFL